MNKIEIFDTTLRDGEQATQGFKHGKESKLEMARKLAEMKIDTIEAGYPKSSPEEISIPLGKLVRLEQSRQVARKLVPDEVSIKGKLVRLEHLYQAP